MNHILTKLFPFLFSSNPLDFGSQKVTVWNGWGVFHLPVLDCTLNDRTTGLGLRSLYLWTEHYSWQIVQAATYCDTNFAPKIHLIFYKWNSYWRKGQQYSHNRWIWQKSWFCHIWGLRRQTAVLAVLPEEHYKSASLTASLYLRNVGVGNAELDVTFSHSQETAEITWMS